MPSSNPETIVPLINTLRSLKPNAILDIGVGCGKFGLLIREYLDGHWTGRAFHNKETWKTVLIGMEVYREYITPVHKYLYDEIIVGDAYDYLMKNTGRNFNAILMADVLEHFTKDQGYELLERLRDHWLHSRGAIIVATPNVQTQINNESLAVFGNKHEVHRCRWSAEDFMNLSMKIEILCEGRHLVVVMREL